MANAAAHGSINRSTSRMTQKTTKRLLFCGIVAGPFYIAVGLIEAYSSPLLSTESLRVMAKFGST